MDNPSININNLAFIFNDNDVKLLIIPGIKYTNIIPGCIMDVFLDLNCIECPKEDKFEYIDEIEVQNISHMIFDSIPNALIPNGLSIKDYILDLERYNKYFHKSEIVTLLFFKI